MEWMNQIGGILQQYAGGGAPEKQGRNIDDDFDQTARAVPRDVLVQSLTQAFRSNATPAFPEIVSNLFSNSEPDQRAGIANTLIQNLGGTGVASMLGSIGLSKLGGVFGGGESHLAPSQANDVSPDAVKELAAQAEQQEPSIVERIAEFYADHPTLVRSLGGAVMAEVLRSVAQKRSA